MIGGRFDKFTIKAQASIEEAANLARDYSHQEIRAEHLFKALLSQEDGIVRSISKKLGISLDSLDKDLTDAISAAVTIEDRSGEVRFFERCA